MPPGWPGRCCGVFFGSLRAAHVNSTRQQRTLQQKSVRCVAARSDVACVACVACVAGGAGGA
eukprot:scaffold105264_cov63-Phaeocystis_antarctica.AAC.5